MGEPLLGKVLDEREPVDHGSEFEIKDNPALETTDLISFNKSASFLSMYQTQYHDDLKGMETLGVLFTAGKS